jgi:hypothetical protein
MCSTRVGSDITTRQWATIEKLERTNALAYSFLKKKSFITSASAFRANRELPVAVAVKLFTVVINYGV